MSAKYTFAAFLSLFLFSWTVSGQNPVSLRDTLPAALKIAVRNQNVRADNYPLDPVKARRIVSPIGQGDAIKFIQTLPGVATGGEGGSSYYVRGGNMGSNLLTLDGVPLYGISHLLGLTSVYPGEVIGQMDFQTGGFEAEDGNFTASHIRLQSKEGDFSKLNAQLSATPFLVAGQVSTPLVKDKLSVLTSLRISPAGLIYRGVRGWVNRHQSTLQDFGATVGDVYGKLSWQTGNRDKLSLSYFGSLDSYDFALSDKTADNLGWRNDIVNLNWHGYDKAGFEEVRLAASFNRYENQQNQQTVFEGRDNRFQLRSTLKEISLSGSARKRWVHWSSQFGFKVRGTQFNPGASHRYGGNGQQETSLPTLPDMCANTLLSTLHGSIDYDLPDKFYLRFTVRGNAYLDNLHEGQWILRPDASLTARLHFTRKLGIETTLDAMTQYYHTLEGIPLGLSLDMIIPSDVKYKPEQAYQAYLGLFFGTEKHSLRLGAYGKKLQNLVYYGDATRFFDVVQSDWHNNIHVGEGLSYGSEFLYEKRGEHLSWNLSYTWSKTDRLFPFLNQGRRFPAKYDRRHIANASLDWTFFSDQHRKLGLTTLFTAQSGSWDTLQDGLAPGFMIGQEKILKLPLISGFNNYELPAYIRWDAAVHLELAGKRTTQEITLGVYNLLNRHNPFMIRYNPDTAEWNAVSLIPVMPTLSWIITFCPSRARALP